MAKQFSQPQAFPLFVTCSIWKYCATDKKLNQSKGPRMEASCTELTSSKEGFSSSVYNVHVV